MKKRNVKLFVLFIFICLIVVGCGGKKEEEKKETSESIALKADFLDWKSLHSELSANEAKAEDYNGKWFIYSGIITDITANSCTLYTETYNGRPLNAIKAYLPTSELKKLNNYEVVTVVGKLNYNKYNSELKEAFVFPKSLYDDEHFVVELLSTREGTYTPHYFSGYKYDANGNVTFYKELYYTIGSSGRTSDNYDIYTMIYNDKNQVIKKLFNSQETTYTYDEDGLVLTETTPTASNKNKVMSYVYTYEKDNDGKPIKASKIDSNGIGFNYTYEYDENGNIIKEEKKSKSYAYTYTYTYEGKRLIKKTEFIDGKEKGSIKYFYGVIGKK